MEAVRIIVHYSLHVIVPWFFAKFFGEEHRKKAFLIMIATMAVDLDHLLATPIFDPDRMSIGFHPLHSYPAICFYIVLCLLPYKKTGWPWWLQAVGVGLVFHMITDWQDGTLW